MPVTTIRPATRPATARLHPTWVPVRDADGRTRMEMRWSDATRRARRPDAA